MSPKYSRLSSSPRAASSRRITTMKDFILTLFDHGSLEVVLNNMRQVFDSLIASEEEGICNESIDSALNDGNFLMRSLCNFFKVRLFIFLFQTLFVTLLLTIDN